MANDMEGEVKKVYRQWKAKQPHGSAGHPDEETFAAFFDRTLPERETERLITHLLRCDGCSELVCAQIKMGAVQEIELPESLAQRTRELIQQELTVSCLQIVIKLKDNILALVNTTGDVLVGQELVPAAVLRSRQIKDFKDEITILKDFQDLRVEVKVVAKDAAHCTVTVLAKEKATQKIYKDVRVSLYQAAVELESYLSDSGKVSFENVVAGKYTIEITGINDKLAAITMDMQI